MEARIQDTPKADVLLVDDRPDQLVALEAVVADLRQNVVKARSGREALRHLLHHDFAVIVLDVDMPGMDGYETATLIRQRRTSEHTPIIFVSAYASSETHISQGYSLGAVDYIQRPIVPEVLRAKVAAFVDLHRKSTELRLIEEAEHRRRLHETQAKLEVQTQRLRQLAQASLAINSRVAIEEILQSATDEARRMLDAHRAAGCLAVDGNGSNVVRVSSRSPADQSRGDLELAAAGVAARLAAMRETTVLSANNQEVDAAWRELVQASGLQNCVCAPLTGRQGGNVGYMLVADRDHGDFTPDDELLLMHLAQMASLAVTNTLYFEAREANRMKDEFLATLSHELRTPLTAILGWAWLLRSSNTPTDVAHEAVEIIERNARAQAKLIDDMLDISRIITGKLRINRQEVWMRAPVEAAVEALRPAAESKGLRLSLQVDSHLSLVAGDPDRLHQVVSNLVSNAIKFTPEHGSVEVRLREEDHTIRLEVEDSGIGIAPNFLPHVFERFRQADATASLPRSGLGLGLAIVRHLVELHGGTVDVESAGPGRGSTFTVRLPQLVLQPGALERGAHAPAGFPGRRSRRAAAPRRSLSLAGMRVLVVDDDGDSRATVAMVLRQFRAEVIEAGSAAEALLHLDSASEAKRPHILVSDVAMPDEDGCTLIRRIRAREAESGDHLPALALTAFAREEDRVRVLAAGFEGHLAKPVVPEQLAVLMRSLVRQPARPVTAGDQPPLAH